MPRADAIAEIKENLAAIALGDTKSVIETNAAMERMAELGLDASQVRLLLTENPPVTVQLDGKPLREEGKFFGFSSRKQASMAAFGGTRKSDRPGALGDTHDRVNTLLKNQEAPKAAGTIGLAIIAIPAMEALPSATQEVRRFRRKPDGKLRELAPLETAVDFIDVEEEAAESTITMREPRERKDPG